MAVAAKSCFTVAAQPAAVEAATTTVKSMALIGILLNRVCTKRISERERLYIRGLR